jgi:hypothetical protein
MGLLFSVMSEDEMAMQDIRQHNCGAWGKGGIVGHICVTELARISNSSGIL